MGPFLLFPEAPPSDPPAEATWALNDIAPLPLAMGFAAPAPPWTTQVYWSIFEMAFESTVATGLRQRTLMGVGL